jgi:dienelactone hydrolase
MHQYFFRVLANVTTALCVATLLCSATFLTKAQASTHTKKILLNPADSTKVLPIAQTIGGYWEYLPDGYNPNGSTIYPLMIFAHGLGENANCTNASGAADATACTPAQWNTSLDRVLANGPPKLIKNGTFPASFTVNGQTFSFIVISPQFNSWPYASSTTRQLVDYLIAQGYKIDTTRVYATGLSMGGGSTWYAAAGTESVSGGTSNVGKMLAAAVPISAADGSSASKGLIVSQIGLPIWATHNNDDGTVTVNNTKDWSRDVNVNKPVTPMRMTIWPTGGHDAWSKTYDPSYREDGKNIYEWMLQYRRASLVAIAGNDKTPDVFTIADKSQLAQSQPVVSDAITVSGLNSGDAVTVSVYGADQASNTNPVTEYSIGCTGIFTSATGTVTNGQTICLRHTTSSALNASVTSWLRVGGVYGSFKSTTAASVSTTQTLTVAKSGNGTGSFSTTPVGTLQSTQPGPCGQAGCALGFNLGTSVTLTATADVGSTFAGWSGACVGTASCTLTMDAAKSVTFTFMRKLVGDLNGDSKSDLLIQSNAGTTTAWLMNGTAITSATNLLANDPSWTISHIADFDGDGKADILWRNTDGRVTLWLMNGSSILSSVGLLGADANWRVSHVGDFNGDGKADILWRNTNGAVTLWLMNGTAITSTATGLIGPDANWTISHIADFNGDGKADLLWRNTNGAVTIWLMSGTSTISAVGVLGADPNWTVSHTADFNGDGKADLLWRNTNGAVTMWLMNGTALTSAVGILGANPDWSVSHTGDFNGDGQADLLWRNTNGAVTMWLMNGTATTATAGLIGADANWRVSHISDLNGDGKSDLIWRNTDGSITVWTINGTTTSATAGLSGAGTLKVVP